MRSSAGCAPPPRRPRSLELFYKRATSWRGCEPGGPRRRRWPEALTIRQASVRMLCAEIEDGGVQLGKGWLSSRNGQQAQAEERARDRPPHRTRGAPHWRKL
jgi:hypothetical protein